MLRRWKRAVASASCFPRRRCPRRSLNGGEPSLLLQHIHRAVPTVAELYRAQQGSGEPAGGRVPPGPSLQIPTKDPETAQEGEQILQSFCEGLGMGAPAMRRWRAKLHKAFGKRWGSDADAAPGKEAAASPRPLLTCAAPERVQACVSLSDLVASSLSGSSGRWDRTDLAAVGQPKGTLFFQPREQDVAFVRSCATHLRAVVSPLITLSPPGRATAEEAARVGASPRATTYAESSRMYATRLLPAGVFVLSVPTEAALVAEPPPATDPVLSYFLCLDDLVGQLVAVEEEGALAAERGEAETEATAGTPQQPPPPPPHYGYVQYLKESVVPPRNLPFLSKADITKLLGAEAEDCPARVLWGFLQEEMHGEPLAAFLRERLSKEEYTWWMSVVLSRRAGASMLIPLVDKLNHSILPNCYYTMSSPQSFCCLDVLDNLMAGVAAELLYQPYIHVYTLREVQPGEELTVCYSSPANGLYRRASGSAEEPERPASLQQPHPHSQGGPARPGDRRLFGNSGRRSRLPQDAVESGGPADEAAMLEAMSALFPSVPSETDGSSLPQNGRRQFLSSLLHPGKQQVDTPEGRASWQLQWGFVPSHDAVYSEADLREMAALVAEKRVNMRKQLFPLS